MKALVYQQWIWKGDGFWLVTGFDGFPSFLAREKCTQMAIFHVGEIPNNPSQPIIRAKPVTCRQNLGSLERRKSSGVKRLRDAASARVENRVTTTTRLTSGEKENAWERS
jgi:hypothetical protein